MQLGAAHTSARWRAGYATDNASLWVGGAVLGALTSRCMALRFAWCTCALPLTLVNSVVQPVIAQLYATNDKPLLQRALRGVATLIGLPALGILTILCGIAAFGQPILGTINGPHYTQAALVLSILSVGR